MHLFFYKSYAFTLFETEVYKILPFGWNHEFFP